MIRAAGVGSGIDVESIISQLMELEREPLNRLEEQRRNIDVKISSLGTFKGILSELETQATRLADSSIFGKYTANSSDEELVSVDISTGTKLVNHDVEVLSLAESHQLATNLYAEGESSAFPQGTYNFESNDESFDVILQAGSTLLSMRDAINDHTDNTNVRASILNLEGGSRLVITSIQPGQENTISAPAEFIEHRAAKDAQMTVDGFAASSPTNDVSNVITGINLHLLDTGKVSIKTSRDNDSVKEDLDSFVSVYNSVISNVDSLLESQFPGDSTIRNITTELRRNFFQTVEVKSNSYSLLDLGLSFDRNGTLSLDESKLTDLQSSDNYADILSATTLDETGLANNIIATLDRYTDSDGLLQSKNDALKNNTNTLNTQGDRLQYQLTQTEDRYRRQFSAMDSVVSQLQSSSSYLLGQLQNLPTYNN